MADWCALPEGVAALIARRFQLIEDFIAFRATCTPWREGTTFKDFYTSASCPKLPLLMLDKYEYPDEDEYTVSVECYDEHHQRKDPEDERKHLSKYLSASRKYRSEYLRKHPADEREFLSLSKGKTCKFSFPEAKGMECRGSKGWFTMAERRTGSYIVFWKPGNETWTRVEIPPCVDDLNYYNGKFYALTYAAEVWMCDVSGPNPNNKASKITELPWRNGSRPKAQLVECGGRLLVVAPFFDHLNDTPYEHDLEMVELDVIKGSYSIVTSLGSSTVFLGRNQGFSIDANKFGGIIEPNLIYFSDGISRIAARGPDHISPPCFSCGVWVSF